MEAQAPDMPRLTRKQALEKLLDELSDGELLDVRREATQRIGRAFEGFGALPSELVIIISQDLDLDDILRAGQVSRVWRGQWRDQAVARSICSRRFPGMLNMRDRSRAPATTLLLQAWKDSRKKLPLTELGFARAAEGPGAAAGDQELEDPTFGQRNLACSIRHQSVSYVCVHDLGTNEIQRIPFGSFDGWEHAPVAVSSKLLVVKARRMDPADVALDETRL
jgi:hypothetical protein